MRIVTIPAIALIAALAAGCQPLIVEQEMPRPGYSVRQAVALQIYDPSAGGTEPVVGLDGRHVQQSMTNYVEQPVPSEETKARDLESVFAVGSD